MTARVSSNALDNTFSYISSNATHLVLLSGDAVNFAGIAAVELGRIAVVGGDFTVGAGDVSGRKVTIAAKTGLTPTASGVVTHVAIINNTGSELLLQAEHIPTNVTNGINVNTNAFDYELPDPVTE